MPEDKEGLIYETGGTVKQEQQPQAYCDRQDAGYDNDVPANSWLRSDGSKKPGFDQKKAGR